MKTVLYTCPYVPAEWIAAHGLRPWRIVCSAAGPDAVAARREGMCAYARSFLNEALSRSEVDAVVMTTLCDQMRRAFDVPAVGPIRAFLLNIPATWQSAGAFDYYVEELRRLGRFLVAVGGLEPSSAHLTAIMGQYQAARRSILGARPGRTARRWAELVERFGRGGPAGLDEAPDPPQDAAEGREARDEADGWQRFAQRRPDSVRPLPSVKAATPTQYAMRHRNDEIALAIIGGPLLKQDFDIYDLIEDNGGRIVFDATETGERGWPGQFDPAALAEDPLTALGRAYFEGVRDPSRRPNDPLHAWLKDACRSHRVRGVIYYRHLWCDAWHAELSRVKHTLGLPVLAIEAACEGVTAGQGGTRDDGRTTDMNHGLTRIDTDCRADKASRRLGGGLSRSEGLDRPALAFGKGRHPSAMRNTQDAIRNTKCGQRTADRIMAFFEMLR